MRYFFNIESGCYESENAIRKDYFTYYEHDFDSFSDFLSACSTMNNGALESLETREKHLKKLLYTFDDDDDKGTINAIKSELSMIRALQAQEKTGEFAMINFTFNGKYKIVERSGKTLYKYPGTGFDDVPFDVVLREIIRIEFNDEITITVE